MDNKRQTGRVPRPIQIDPLRISWERGQVALGGKIVDVVAGQANVSPNKDDCSFPNYGSCNIVYADPDGAVSVTFDISVAGAAGNSLLAFIQTNAGRVTQISYPSDSIATLPVDMTNNGAGGGGGGGGGDVTTFGSVVDGHLAVFRGTSGNVIQDGGAVPSGGGGGGGITASGPPSAGQIGVWTSATNQTGFSDFYYNPAGNNVGLSLYPTPLSGSTSYALDIQLVIPSSSAKEEIGQLSINGPDMGAGSTVDSSNGILIRNQGASGITNAYGLNIAPVSGATNNFNLWSGPALADMNAQVQSDWTGYVAPNAFLAKDSSSSYGFTAISQSNTGGAIGGIINSYHIGSGQQSHALELQGTAVVGDGETVDNIVGLTIFSNFKAGAGTVTDNYGLVVNDQTAGVNNWAIRTGLGLVEFGDKTTINYVDSGPSTSGLIVNATSGGGSIWVNSLAQNNGDNPWTVYITNSANGKTGVDFDGIVVETPTADGGSITNARAITIRDQTAGANNWAIKTGLGLVEFGDNVHITGTATDTTKVQLGSDPAFGAAGGFSVVESPTGNYEAAFLSYITPVPSADAAYFTGTEFILRTDTARPVSSVVGMNVDTISGGDAVVDYINALEVRTVAKNATLLEGLLVSTSGAGVSVGTIATKIGIRVDDVSGATANYALKTGLGLVEFGDTVAIRIPDQDRSSIDFYNQTYSSSDNVNMGVNNAGQFFINGNSAQDFNISNFNVSIDQTLKAGGYKSSDGSAGINGTITSLNTATVKNGLITAIT